jgi:hypothetical protein
MIQQRIIFLLLLVWTSSAFALDTGSIQVIIEPSQAISQEARWRPKGWTDWYESGRTLSGFTPEKWVVEFKKIPCWEKASDQNVYVEPNHTSIVRGKYFQERGDILINIIPNDINAKWCAVLKEVGGTSSWYDGGDKISEFIPGSTQIQFIDVSGWEKPSDINVDVQCNGIVTATAQYCKKIAQSPTNINASDGQSNRYIHLSWSEVPCIETFSIWRSTQNNTETAEKIAEISSQTAYTDTSASPDHLYYYWVRSVNEYGTHDFGTPDFGYLMLKSPLYINASDGDFPDSIKLEWAPVPGAMHYEIWRSRQNNSTTADRIAASISSTNFEDTTIKPECHYYYWVKAKNDHVTGHNSPSDDGFRNLASVTGVKADDGKYYDQICVRWDENTDAIAYDLIIAETTRKRDSRASENIISTQNTYVCDVAAIPERRYYYRVVAKNECGESLPSAHDIGYMRLKYPDNIYASCEFSNKVSINWNSVTGAEYYEIWKGPNSDISSAEMLDSSVIRTSYDDPVTPGQDMYYFVRSRNSYGKSEFSDPIKGCTQSCTYQVSQTEKTFDLTGGSDSIQISATEGCEWNSFSNQPWIHLIESSASGSAGIIYSVDASETNRTGSITIKGTNFEKNVSIIQQQYLILSIQGSGMIKINNETHSLPFSQEYEGASSLILEYLPAQSCQFLYWSGDYQNTDNPLRIQLSSHTSLIPNQTCPVNLNISGLGEGDVSIDNEPVHLPLVESYEKGTVIELSTPESSDFKYWDIDGTQVLLNPYELEMDSDKTVIATFNTGWSIDISALAEDLGGAYKSTIVLGVGLEQKIPAPPLPPKFSCNMSISDQENWDNLSTQIFPDCEKSYTWVISLNPHGNIGPAEARDCTLTWNPEQLPPEGIFQIREGHDGSGSIIVKDMREQSQIVINGGNEYKNYTITLSDTSWRANFYARGINLGGTYKSTVTVGVESTENVLPAPPIPPGFTCRMTLIPVPDWSTEHSSEIQAYGNNSYAWVFAINPHGNSGSPEARSCTITWNPAEFTSSGYYKLREGYDGTGEIVIADLRKTTQLVVTGKNETKHYTLIWSESSPFDYDLKKGWNLVSLPRVPDDNTLSSIFPDAVVAYAYDQGEYIKTDNLYPGIGYWIQVNDEQSYTLNGPVYDESPDSLISGWNLIGAGDVEISLKDQLGDSVIVIYKYADGEYIQVDTIVPGFGYWVSLE